MTTPDAPWEPRPSYVQLHALACEMREDWNPDDLKDAMTAVIHGGWSWKEIYKEVMRLAWAEGETPSTLRNSARRPGAAATAAPLDRDLFAALRAGDFDAVYMATHDGAAPVRRGTGPLQRLTEDNDTRESA